MIITRVRYTHSTHSLVSIHPILQALMATPQKNCEQQKKEITDMRKKNASIKERGEKEKSIFGSNISNGIYKKSAFCPIFVCIFTTQLYFFSSNISAVSRTYTNAHIEEEKKNFLVDLKAPKKKFYLIFRHVLCIIQFFFIANINKNNSQLFEN